jgi:hypothetical protein
MAWQQCVLAAVRESVSLLMHSHSLRIIAAPTDRF